MGWVHSRRDHGGVVFVDLRDRTGLVQVVFNPEHSPAAHERAGGLRSEYVIAVRGTVRARPPETVNPNLATGEVEVVAGELRVLNESRRRRRSRSRTTAASPRARARSTATSTCAGRGCSRT